MSFTDEENKLIEDEENKAEEEIRARFKSFFSEEELESAAKEFRDENAAEEAPRSSGTQSSGENKRPKRVSGAGDSSGPSKKARPRTVKRSDVQDSEKPVRKKRPRISGPDYSLSGHKIINDSNFRDSIYADDKPVVRKRSGKAVSHRVSERVFLFEQDSIPTASSELTRRAKINSTSKVRKREKRLLNAKDAGLVEHAKKAQVSVYSQELLDELQIAKEELSTRQAEEIRAARREARAQAEIEKASGTKKAKPRRKTSKRHVVSSDTARIGTIDNSKKSLRAREKAIRRNKKSSPAKLIINLVVLALIIGICVFGYQAAKMVFDDTPMNPNDTSKIEFTVDSSTTDDVVAQFLVKNNMVENEFIYKLRAKIFDADYVEGTYELSPSFSTEKIINTLSGFDYSSGG